MRSMLRLPPTLVYCCPASTNARSVLPAGPGERGRPPNKLVRKVAAPQVRRGVCNGLCARLLASPCCAPADGEGLSTLVAAGTLCPGATRST